MTEQPGEQRVTGQVGEKLISLMVPDVDLELIHLMLSCAARSTAGGNADDKGRRSGGNEPQAGLLRELVELLVLIRDSGMDRAQLRTILGLNPEALTADDDGPHSPNG